MTDYQPDDIEDRIREAYQSAARTVQTLQQPSPVLAGPVRRSRRMTLLTPIAAAAAVIMVITASVALPRLAGSARNPAGPEVSAAGHYPPFQVVVTVKSNSDSSLQVESAATGQVVSTVALPWPGAVWGAVTAVGDTGRFIVAAAPKNVPTQGFSDPTRLYTLTLSARGTVTGLTPLGVPVLQGQVTSLAASADGRTVAYTLLPLDARSAHFVGIITGRTTRQWSIGGLTRTGTGNLSLFDVSVSRDGSMVAFTAQDQVVGDTVWVLPTGSAPGSITATARKVYQHEPIYGPGNKVAWLDSALISPDGSTLYLATSGNSASGKVVTTLTAYRTAGGASPVTVTAFDGGFDGGVGEVLTPASGGMLLAWNLNVPTAYLINPATRTRTTLRLHGVPRLLFTNPPQLVNVFLAW